MNYELLKALHLIFVVTWFAGLFYIVRLFIYHTEASHRSDLNQKEKELFFGQYELMEKRLWYGITWPSLLLTLILGFTLLFMYFLPLTAHPWLKLKLVLVFFLLLYHLSCGHILKKLKKQNFVYSSKFLRIWNEVATLFLFAIVFLAIFKSGLGLVQGLGGLFLLTIFIILGMFTYNKLRKH